jgi:hypothetical protein
VSAEIDVLGFLVEAFEDRDVSSLCEVSGLLADVEGNGRCAGNGPV